MDDPESPAVGRAQANAASYAREEWDDDDVFVNHEQAQFLLVSGGPRPTARPCLHLAALPPAIHTLCLRARALLHTPHCWRQMELLDSLYAAFNYQRGKLVRSGFYHTVKQT